MPNPSASSVGGKKLPLGILRSGPSMERALVFSKQQQQQHTSGQAPSHCTASTSPLLHLGARGIWDVNSGPCIVPEP